MMKVQCQSLTLEHHGRAYALPPEIFKWVKDVVEFNHICEWCGSKFSQERPEVTLNKCLHCFLGDDASGYTYVGETPSGWSRFLGHLNHIYITSPDCGGQYPQEDITETLHYWKFSIPASMTIAGEHIIFDGSWSLLGDVTQAVIVARHYWNWGPNKARNYHFLLYKDRPGFLIDRRKAEVRKMIQAAEAQVTDTKNPYYHELVYEKMAEIECQRLIKQGVML